MSFAYEHEMTRPAERWLESLCLYTKREYPTSWGICDLMGFSFNKAKVDQRRELGQRAPIGPPLRISLLLMMPDHEKGTGIRLRTLQRRFEPYIQPEDITTHVEKLVRTKFARRTKHGTFVKVNGWMPVHERIVAVELKLSKVGEAILQASSHKSITAESYIGLPTEVACHVANGRGRRRIESAGVGLLSVGKKNCRVLIEPSLTDTPRDRLWHTHCAERFWRTHAKYI